MPLLKGGVKATKAMLAMRLAQSLGEFLADVQWTLVLWGKCVPWELFSVK